MKRVFTCLVVLLSVILLGLPVTISSKPQTDSENMLSYQTEKSVSYAATFMSNYNSKKVNYQKLIQDIPGFEGYRVEEIKLVYGFNGDPYEVVECEPTGYLIYQAENDVLLEFTSKGKSPYHGKSGNLLYIGPTYYYQAKASKQAFKFAMTDLCQNKEITLSADKFNEVKNFSKNVNDSINKKAKEDKDKINALKEQSIVQPMGTYTKDGKWEYWYVKNKSTITNLTTNFGYIQGYGGFNVTTIMLYYLHMNKYGSFLPYDCLDPNGPNTGATNWLINIARTYHNYYEPLIGGPKIGSVLRTHLKLQFLDIAPYFYGADGDITPTWDHTFVRNSLLNDFPVALFGTITEPFNVSEHAVLAFGSMRENIFLGLFFTNYHIVHFAIPSSGGVNYTEVVVIDNIVTNIFGSIAYIFQNEIV